MQLNNLRPFHRLKSKKRIGRGGKRGTYSGKGQKGQKSRAGHKIKPQKMEGLLRVPKMRGYKNKPKREKEEIINVGKLSKIQSSEINLKSILDSKIVPHNTKSVKILGEGEIKEKKNIKGIKVSKSATKKILDAGGTIS
jgi:large subunit ribosomal protein L15